MWARTFIFYWRVSENGFSAQSQRGRTLEWKLSKVQNTFRQSIYPGRHSRIDGLTKHSEQPRVSSWRPFHSTLRRTNIFQNFLIFKTAHPFLDGAKGEVVGILGDFIPRKLSIQVVVESSNFFEHSLDRAVLKNVDPEVF